MRIKVIKSFHDIENWENIFEEGSIVELEDKRAARIIETGYAEAYDEEPASEDSEDEDANEEPASEEQANLFTDVAADEESTETEKKPKANRRSKK